MCFSCVSYSNGRPAGRPYVGKIDAVLAHSDFFSLRDCVAVPKPSCPSASLSFRPQGEIFLRSLTSVRLCENPLGALRRSSGRTVKYLILLTSTSKPFVLRPSKHERGFY